MAIRWPVTSTASTAPLWVLAQAGGLVEVVADARDLGVRQVQVRTRPTDRRTRSDSVKPAERALACHSARSASLARVFTRTARPALITRRRRWGGQRGHSPPPAPAGDPRSVAPKGRLAPVRRTISSTNAWSPGPSKSPYPYIEEPALCGVNNGKGEVVPGGPTKCQSRTKIHQWKLEGSRCPGLSRWLDDNSPAPAFDQIAPRTNPKLVLLDKEPETLGNQFQVAIRLFCGCLWGDDLPPRVVPHPMLVPAPVALAPKLGPLGLQVFELIRVLGEGSDGGEVRRCRTVQAPMWSEVIVLLLPAPERALGVVQIDMPVLR